MTWFSSIEQNKGELRRSLCTHFQGCLRQCKTRRWHPPLKDYLRMSSACFSRWVPRFSSRYRVLITVLFWVRLGFARNGPAAFEVKGRAAKGRTHRWQTGVPRGCVITAGTDANITVVHLGCAQAMRSSRVFQVLVLLPPEAC